jgi:CheY-like chemotaxis protein
VCTTTSAEGALERIQNERYSLILVDIKLPGMSGSELYNRVRQMARSLAHRVVFITGDLMSNDTRSFVSRARVPCITKPFNAEGIKREVRRLLS